MNASLNDVILAMCSGALLRYLQEFDTVPTQSLNAAVPVSVRDRHDDTSDVANAVSFTITNLATDVADPIDRLKAIKSSMDYNKERMRRLTPNQLQAYSAMMFMPGAVGMLLGNNKALSSVVISHMPGPRRDLYWQGAKLSGLYPASLVIDKGALNITIVSRHDVVDIGLIACRKSVPHMQRLLDYLEDSLCELEAGVVKLQAAAANPKVIKPKAVKAAAPKTAAPKISVAKASAPNVSAAKANTLKSAAESAEASASTVAKPAARRKSAASKKTV